MKVSRIMIFLLVYLLILLVIFLLQRKMIYFPTHFTQGQLEKKITSLNLQPWPSVNELQGMISNIAVLLAEQDKVIPNRRTMALFDALPERKKLWRFEKAGHNNLPLEPWRPWWQESMQFIDQ